MGAADKSLCFLAIEGAARLIVQRKISPVELVQSFLARIEAVDGALATYITVDADGALAAARQAETEIMRGASRGPLHGIPYGLKDNFAARGARMTANSRLMLKHVADSDATAHRRLQDAGAILLGKLSTYEYGTGDGDDLFELPFRPARNPWDPRRFPGGSTLGGGAAVAAGTAMLALGTDTTGSVRLPAAACGVAGLKPTYGLVSRAGALPNCYSLDCVGPIAWTAQGTRLALGVIAGFDPLDPASADVDVARVTQGDASVKGLRVGVLRRFHERDVKTDRELSGGFHRTVEAFRGLGVTIVECDLAASLQEFRNCSRIINTAECYTIHERDYLERGHEMGVALRNKLDFGSVVAAADYLRAQRWRRALADEVERLFDQVDVILCAGTTRVAPDYEDRAGIKAFTGESAMAAFSLSGHPAISVCSGFSALGLPLNVQLAGRRFQDGLVAGTATALETAFALKDRRPPDPGAPPPAPAWTSEPAPQIALSERMLRARSAVGTVVSQLPQDLPKSLEPFVTVNTRSDHEVE
jgi:aspartyl-tRNA(Asn)/glutamyl-tRNA(Gln) amidotransferase subunit A